jgi:hypothetical protein
MTEAATQGFCDFRQFHGHGIVGGDSGYELHGTLWCDLAETQCRNPHI